MCVSAEHYRLRLAAHKNLIMGEKMEKTKRNATKIALAILAILLASSTLVLLGNSVVVKSSI